MSKLTLNSQHMGKPTGMFEATNRVRSSCRSNLHQSDYMWSTLLLFLFTLNLGMAFGAGIYEQRLVVPRWFIKSNNSTYIVNTEAMRELDSGRNFWAFVTTIPLTLLTLANLILAWQSAQQNQPWWLAAAGLTLVERLGTFCFFIPTVIRLQKADKLSASQTTHLVKLWISSNYIRNALTLTGWILALIALSR